MNVAKRVSVVGDTLRIRLVGGCDVERPIHWYPILNLAPPRVRKRVRVIAAGAGLRWPTLGYELGVDGVVRQRKPLRF